MRRIQIHLEEDVDDALAAEAARRGISKAALIRELVRQAFPGPSRDPVEAVIGAGDGEPVDDIDRVLYG
ncbi:MAG: antitoxin VapB20 [Acidimicrobiia bacterium]|nr:MAG: antitoxin VapB20 [Acidimicrobiia bacterium]